MFLHVSAILLTGGSLCPGVIPVQGGSVQGVSLSRGAFCPGGSLSRGAFCPGGSLSGGISVRETTLYGNEQAVRILVLLMVSVLSIHSTIIILIKIDSKSTSLSHCLLIGCWGKNCVYHQQS